MLTPSIPLSDHLPNIISLLQSSNLNFPSESNSAQALSLLNIALSYQDPYHRLINVSPTSSTPTTPLLKSKHNHHASSTGYVNFYSNVQPHQISQLSIYLNPISSPSFIILSLFPHLSCKPELCNEQNMNSSLHPLHSKKSFSRNSAESGGMISGLLRDAISFTSNFFGRVQVSHEKDKFPENHHNTHSPLSSSSSLPISSTPSLSSSVALAPGSKLPSSAFTMESVLGRTIKFYDPKVGYTYIISRVDTGSVLVSIYNGSTEHTGPGGDGGGIMHNEGDMSDSDVVRGIEIDAVQRLSSVMSYYDLREALNAS